MKKTLVLSILGLAAAAVSSYGQGSISFNTYLAAGNSGIITTYGSGGNAGNGIDSTFTGELLWSTANIVDAATTAPVTAGSLLTAGWNLGSVGTFDTGNAPLAGYIAAPDLSLTASQLGGNNVHLTLYFEVVAFSGGAYATAGQWSGHSATFTGTLVQSPNPTDANQMNNLSPFSVYSVISAPEPSSLALAGLGGFGMLMAFRRKKATSDSKKARESTSEVPHRRHK
jgi:hypothetical protein